MNLKNLKQIHTGLKILYRYELKPSVAGPSEITQCIFTVKKETDKGYWITDRHYKKRWCKKNACRTYAFITQEEAWNDFISRLYARRAILRESTIFVENGIKLLNRYNNIKQYKAIPAMTY